MNGRGPVHFDVQLSEPYTYESNTMGPAVDGKPTLVPVTRQSMRNISVDVITISAQRAIELALKHHPLGVVHVVQKRGMTNLLFDPEIVKELIEGS